MNTILNRPVIAAALGAILGPAAVIFFYLHLALPPSAPVSFQDNRGILTHLEIKGAVVLTQSGCRACEAARNWINSEKISVVWIEFDHSDTRSKIVTSQLHRLVFPTLITPNATVYGFDESIWKAQLR